jgi:hypothetical protein
LNRPGLSQLLERAEAEVDDAQFAYEISLFVTLSALRVFSPDGPVGGELTATDDGRRLSTRHIADAPDLLLHPPVDPTLEERVDDVLAS